TWTLSSGGLTATDVRGLAIDPLDSDTLYAGTNGGGVFRSEDAGKSWLPLNDGLTDLHVGALAIDASGSRLHAVTESGGFDLFSLRERPAIERVKSRSTTREIVPR